MVDEAFDTEFAGQNPQPHEFRSKNPFQKSLAICGGVIFNICLAILLFTIVTLGTGDTTYKTTEIGKITENSIGSFCGFKAGDIVISINQTTPEH
jgi:regulator of sigma E protease